MLQSQHYRRETERLRAEIERLTERCEAYKGQVKDGANEIERLRSAVDQRLADAEAENTKLRRTIWLLLSENGGVVILNKATTEGYPGDDRAIIDVTTQSESGSTIMRALTQQTQNTEK